MAISAPAATPKPPYYACIFTSLRTSGDDGYGVMSEKMLALAHEQPGFLGVESTRGADGFGITVSYWSDLESIAHWKQVLAHREAQEEGRRSWYSQYRVRVARVERDYGHDA